jgi:transcription antitermination factor NusG
LTGSILADILTDAERRPPANLYAEPHWYACYTRARHEKQVEAQLRRRGMESYLPMVRQVRQWSDRKKTLGFPLFPGYVFGRFTLGEQHAVLTTPGVSTIVRTNGYPTPIPPGDLDNVKTFVAALADLGLEPDPRPFFAEGEWVRVMEGPFEGVEGIVVEARGRKRVLVGLAAIGQGLEIDIDTRLLKAIKR